MNVLEFLQQDIFTDNDKLLLEQFNSVSKYDASIYNIIVDDFIKSWEHTPQLKEAVHYLAMEYYLFQKWLIKSWFSWQE